MKRWYVANVNVDFRVTVRSFTGMYEESWKPVKFQVGIMTEKP